MNSEQASSQMALTGQRIAMVDLVLLVFPAFPYPPQGWIQSQSQGALKGTELR